MENASFSFAYSPLESHEKDVVMIAKHDHLFELEDWGEMDSLCSEYGSYQYNVAEKGVRLSIDQQQKQHQKPISNYSVFDDFHIRDVSPPIQTTQESGKLENIQTGISDFVGPKKERSVPRVLIVELK
ncbi:hypothetical protein L1049_003647 [Liquidambar formosana]|uniref:Uncharacterized protein n=1 Tax=Liquidambar formosana TaxID=63359 RepID=A0AAP0RQZ6_LIQFO